MESRKLTELLSVLVIFYPVLIAGQPKGESYNGAAARAAALKGSLDGRYIFARDQQSQSYPIEPPYYISQQAQVQSYPSPYYNQPQNAYSPNINYHPSSPVQKPQVSQYPQSNVPYSQSQSQSQVPYAQPQVPYAQPPYLPRPAPPLPINPTHYRPQQNPQPPQTYNTNNQKKPALNNRIGDDQSNSPPSVTSFQPETVENWTSKPTRASRRPIVSSTPGVLSRFDDRDGIKKKLSFDTALSASMETFALELFSEFHERLQKTNFMISPFSVYHMLVLIAEGAGGNTFKEINDKLNLLGAKNLTRTRDFQQYLNVALNKNTADVILRKFALLVSDQNRPVLREYEALVEKVYDALELAVNFQEPEKTARDLNKVISNYTNGQINNTVEKDDLIKAQLLLISGLYFQGKWMKVFNQTFTKQEMFYDTNGNPLGPVNMMFQLGPFLYSAVADLGCHVLELPYAEQPINSRLDDVPNGTGLSMILVLPRKGLSLEEAIGKVYQQGMEKIYRELYYAKEEFDDDEVEVHLPRFTMETSLDMKETLQALGISAIFDQSRADLSKISPQYYVSGMIHKTKIVIDEMGINAAAGTDSKSAYKSTPLQFHANKPFFFLIVDRVTKLILFCGQYVSPELT